MGHRGHMVVGFITTHVIVSAYHH